MFHNKSSPHKFFFRIAFFFRKNKSKIKKALSKKCFLPKEKIKTSLSENITQQIFPFCIHRAFFPRKIQSEADQNTDDIKENSRPPLYGEKNHISDAETNQGREHHP